MRWRDPSDMALADDAVHVANQDSGTITVLALDTDPGLLLSLIHI